MVMHFSIVYFYFFSCVFTCNYIHHRTSNYVSAIMTYQLVYSFRRVYWKGHLRMPIGIFALIFINRASWCLLCRTATLVYYRQARAGHQVQNVATPRCIVTWISVSILTRYVMAQHSVTVAWTRPRVSVLNSRIFLSHLAAAAAVVVVVAIAVVVVSAAVDVVDVVDVVVVVVVVVIVVATAKVIIVVNMVLLKMTFSFCR